VHALPGTNGPIVAVILVELTKEVEDRSNFSLTCSMPGGGGEVASSVIKAPAIAPVEAFRAMIVSPSLPAERE
jgi:hypothetical protein